MNQENSLEKKENTTTQELPQNQNLNTKNISEQEETPEIKREKNKANWKQFREQQEAQRKAKEQAERVANEEKARAEALKAALEAITRNNHQHDQYEDLEETEEQKIDKRVEAKIREIEEKREKERLLKEQNELPQKINQFYPDFNRVCSNENIDYMKFHYPEVADALTHLPDSFDNWSKIYKTVKRLVPNLDSLEDQKKIEQNLSKPSSISKPGISQESSLMGSSRLSDEKKTSNWERMQRTLKGLSN